MSGPAGVDQGPAPAAVPHVGQMGGLAASGVAGYAIKTAETLHGWEIRYGREFVDRVLDIYRTSALNLDQAKDRALRLEIV